MNTLKLLFSARKHSFANQKQIRRIAVKEAKLFQLWNAFTELNASEQQDQREKREKRWLWHTVGSKNLLSRCSSVVEHSTERKNNDHNLCLFCIFLSLNPFYKSPTFHKIYLFISISGIFDNSREDSTLVFWPTLNSSAGQTFSKWADLWTHMCWCAFFVQCVVGSIEKQNQSNTRMVY